MAREAKHALIFVGILLLVFGGLLWKRLHSPAGSGMKLFAQADNKTPESTQPIRAALPAQPTLVTPRPDNDRPSELAINGGSYDLDRNLSARNDVPTRQLPTAWSSDSRYSTDVANSPAKSSNSPTPSLLAASTAIADVGDRYSARPQQS